MASEARRPVVILYKHALLGEGIATYLRAQIGVEVTVRSTHDLEASREALALNPSVVIFESIDPFHRLDLSALAPHAALIDVSTVITRGSVVYPSIAGFEQILQAIRDSRDTAAAPIETAGAAPLETSRPVKTTAPLETATSETHPADSPAAAAT